MGAVWSAERVTAGPHELRETQRQEELAEISVGDVSVYTPTPSSARHCNARQDVEDDEVAVSPSEQHGFQGEPGNVTQLATHSTFGSSRQNIQDDQSRFRTTQAGNATAEDDITIHFQSRCC